MKMYQLYLFYGGGVTGGEGHISGGNRKLFISNLLP